MQRSDLGSNCTDIMETLTSAEERKQQTTKDGKYELEKAPYRVFTVYYAMSYRHCIFSLARGRPEEALRNQSSTRGQRCLPIKR